MIGIKDDVYGENIKAFVVLKPGQTRHGRGNHRILPNKTHEFSGPQRSCLYEGPAQELGGQSAEKGIEKVTIKAIGELPGKSARESGKGNGRINSGS